MIIKHENMRMGQTVPIKHMSTNSTIAFDVPGTTAFDVPGTTAFDVPGTTAFDVPGTTAF